MTKNVDRVSLKKSKRTTEGLPNLPLPEQLVEGELAINYAKDVETISLKNESGTVVTFSSDNYYTERKLGSGFTGENSAKTVTDYITELEGENLWETGTGLHSAVLKGSSGTASGGYAVAEGKGTSATSEASHAEGESTIANAYGSHTEGYNTQANGQFSHAEGQNTIAGKDGYLCGQCHAEGTYTEALGDNSHAEGKSAQALGDNSHAEGESTKALGRASHAEGENTEAYGRASHTEGLETEASGYSSHAEGYQTDANGGYSHAEGNSTQADGEASHAEGAGTQASGDYSHAEGYNTQANGQYSHAEGRNTTASGASSHAEGGYTYANGIYSHAEGREAIADGDYSHAEGNSTRASGYSSHAEGDTTTGSGYYSHAEGRFTLAAGMISHAEGASTDAYGNYSHTEGYMTTTRNQAEHASGYLNNSVSASTTFGVSGNTLFSVGNGSDAWELGNRRYHNAFEIRQNGDIYIANTDDTASLNFYEKPMVRLQDYLVTPVELWESGTGLNSVVLKGSSGTASGGYAVAEGYQTSASGNGSHAEGWATITSNMSEHASGQFNVSSKDEEVLFGSSGSTLFSVGNGTADDNRHNAFEIRQNGDIYIVSGNSDIRLQDYIGGGGSITVDQDFSNTASTNPISTKAVYSAVTDNELVWTNAFVVISGAISSHTEDTSIHVTSADKTNWNAKLDASDIADFFDDAKYEDSGTTKVINFYHGNTIKATIDASDFIVDGMVDDVRIENGNLVIDFNTASGKQDISIPLTDIFDPSNYYNKTQIDNLVGSGFTSSSITDVIIENEQIVSSSLNDLETRKLDASAYTPTDLSNYYTKSETSGKTEISNALQGKVNSATFTAHTADTTIHLTSGDVKTQIDDRLGSGFTGANSANTVTSALNDLENGLVSTATTVSGGTGLSGGGNLGSDVTLSLTMPSVHTAATYTATAFTSDEPIVYCVVTASGDLNNQTCPVTLAEGQQCIVIYKTAAARTISFGTTGIITPDGSAVSITTKANGYCEVNYIKLNGDIFLRGV